MRLCNMLTTFCRHVSKGLKSAWIKQRVLVGLLVLSMVSDTFVTVAHCKSLRHNQHSKHRAIKDLTRVTWQMLERIKELKQRYLTDRFSITVKSHLERMTNTELPLPDLPSVLPKDKTDIPPIRVLTMVCDFKELIELMKISNETEVLKRGYSKSSFARDFQKIITGRAGSSDRNHSIQHLISLLSGLGLSEDPECDITVPEISLGDVIETNRVNYEYLNHVQRYISATKTYMCSLHKNLKTRNGGVHDNVHCQ